MSYHLNTKRGYPFPAVSSAMQKAIRRGDAKLAGYWALELWASGFGHYVWRRLLTVSAEDCWGILTAEVKALHDSYLVINEGVPAKSPKGRIFISKAVWRSRSRVDSGSGDGSQRSTDGRLPISPHVRMCPAAEVS